MTTYKFISIVYIHSGEVPQRFLAKSDTVDDIGQTTVALSPCVAVHTAMGCYHSNDTLSQWDFQV